MALTLRLVKGYELTYTELDDNFIFLSSSYLTTSSFNDFIKVNTNIDITLSATFHIF